MIQVSKNTRTITIFGKKQNLPQKKKATDYPRKTTLNRQKIRTITNRAVRIAPVKKEEPKQTQVIKQNINEEELTKKIIEIFSSLISLWNLCKENCRASANHACHTSF